MIAKLTENQLTKDYQLIFKHNVPGTEPYRFSNVRVSHVFFFLNVISYNKFKFGWFWLGLVDKLKNNLQLGGYETTCYLKTYLFIIHLFIPSIKTKKAVIFTTEYRIHSQDFWISYYYFQ